MPLEHVHDDPSFHNVRLSISEPELLELMESMRHEGLKVPVTVISAPPPSPYVFLRAGFRRTMAARKLGWQQIPAIVLPHTTPQVEEYWTNIIENSNRQRLSTYEIAVAAQTMRDRFGVRSQEFARRAGYSESYVDNLLRCLDKLPPEIIREWQNRAPIPLELYVKWAAFRPEEAVKMMLSYCGRHPQLTRGWRPPPEVKEKYFPAKMASAKGLARMTLLRFAVEVARELDDKSRQLCLHVIDFCTGARDDVPGLYDPSKKIRPYRSRQKKIDETLESTPPEE